MIVDENKSEVEIRIRRDGKVIWVNVDEGCICRISGINNLSLIDEREEPHDPERSDEDAGGPQNHF